VVLRVRSDVEKSISITPHKNRVLIWTRVDK